MAMTARKRREAFDAFSMLAPTLLGLLVFFAFPLAYSLVLSVTDTRLFGDANFVGLDNYVKAIGDPTFHRALGNTLLFSAATLIVSIVPALFLAVLLNEKLPAQAFFRGIYFVPVVASVVGVSLLWRYLLNFDFGFVNYAIRELGKILGTKWEGGTLVFKPGRPGLQEKEVPVETFFKKIVMVRDRLRVLEQKVNTAEKLSDAEKIDMQQYITRCYGSLTTFNMLFDDREDWFVGEKKPDNS